MCGCRAAWLEQQPTDHVRLRGGAQGGAADGCMAHAHVWDQLVRPAGLGEPAAAVPRGQPVGKRGHQAGYARRTALFQMSGSESEGASASGAEDPNDSDEAALESWSARVQGAALLHLGARSMTANSGRYVQPLDFVATPSLQQLMEQVPGADAPRPQVWRRVSGPG